MSVKKQSQVACLLVQFINLMCKVTTRGVLILIIIQQRNASNTSGLASGQRKVSMDMKMICFEELK